MRGERAQVSVRQQREHALSTATVTVRKEREERRQRLTSRSEPASVQCTQRAPAAVLFGASCAHTRSLSPASSPPASSLLLPLALAPLVPLPPPQPVALLQPSPAEAAAPAQDSLVVHSLTHSRKTHTLARCSSCVQPRCVLSPAPAAASEQRQQQEQLRPLTLLSVPYMNTGPALLLLALLSALAPALVPGCGSSSSRRDTGESSASSARGERERERGR